MDLKQGWRYRHPAGRHSSIIAQLTLVSRVDCRNTAFVTCRHFQHLAYAGRAIITEVEVIAYQQDKGIISREFLRTPYRVAVSSGSLLLYQSKAIRMLSCSTQEDVTSSRIYHHCSGIDSGGEKIIKDDCQSGLGYSLEIHQRLEGQMVFRGTGRSNNSFSRDHARSVGRTRRE